MIMLDTDICIEMLKGNMRVLHRREEHDEAIAICFMSAAELYYGVEKSTNPTKNQAIVDEFLLSVEIIQTNLPVLKRFGSIKAQLRREGISLADADILIAAAAIEIDARLITGNTKHFERIPGLTTDNWK